MNAIFKICFVIPYFSSVPVNLQITNNDLPFLPSCHQFPFSDNAVSASRAAAVASLAVVASAAGVFSAHVASLAVVMATAGIFSPEVASLIVVASAAGVFASRVAATAVVMTPVRVFSSDITSGFVVHATVCIHATLIDALFVVEPSGLRKFGGICMEGEQGQEKE